MTGRYRPAIDRLHLAVIRSIEDGDPPPCAGRDEWLSERPALREWAAWHCAPCDLLDECAEAAEEIGASFGVWAGVDRGLRPKARSA